MTSVLTAGDVAADLQGEIVGQVVVGTGTLQIGVGSVHGSLLDVVAPGERPVVRQRRRPIAVLPPPGPQLLDRDDEIDTVKTALRSNRPVELHGPVGVGKTSLLRHLAHDALPPALADGVASLSARGRPLDDLLQCLFDLFWESDRPFKPTGEQIRQALHDTRALLLVDDLDLASEEASVLADFLPSCSMVLASEAGGFPSEQATSIPVGGLSPPAALALVARALHRPLAPGESPRAEELCTRLEGHPLRILQALAPVRDGVASLGEVVASARAPAQAGPAVAPGIGGLVDRDRRVLDLLAALPAPLPLEHVVALTGLSDAHDVLERLQALNLVESQWPGYRLLGDPRWVLEAEDQLDSLRQSALDHFAQWAEGVTAEPDRLEAVVECTRFLVSWGAQRAGGQRSAVRLGRAIEPALVLQRHWGRWQEVLDRVGHAAREVGDHDSQGWVLHEVGTRSLLLDDHGGAEASLGAALRLREATGDGPGAALSRHNLGLLQPPSPGRRSRLGSWPRSMRLAIAVLVLLMAAGVVAAVAWSRNRNGELAGLAPSSSLLAFGPQALGSASPGSILTFRNPQETPTMVGQVSVAGRDQPEFPVVADECSFRPLAPGGTCSLSLRFSPKAVGGRQAEARVPAGGKTTVVPLRGEGVASSGLVVEPTVLTFGRQVVGTESESRRLTVRNDDRSQRLRMVEVRLIGSGAFDFRLVADTCTGIQVRPEQPCSVDVAFAPIRPGRREATVVVGDGGGGSVTAALEGSAEPSGPGEPSAPRVPNVIGQTEAAAVETLRAFCREARCSGPDVHYERTRSAKRGRVIRQRPRPGTPITGGERVSIVVARTPTPTTTPATSQPPDTEPPMTIPEPTLPTITIPEATLPPATSQGTAAPTTSAPSKATTTTAAKKP